MLKTESVPGSIGYLMENICPEMANPLDCETKVGEWWGYVAQVAFNDQVSKYFCYIMDPDCHLFTDESWDCDKCQNDIVSMATGYGNEGTIKNLVDALQGDAFCKNRLLNLETEELIRSCQDFMEEFMPAALELLTQLIKEDAQGRKLRK